MPHYKLLFHRNLLNSPIINCKLTTMLCVMLVPLACAVGAATAATFQRTASFYDKLQCRGDAADAGASDNVIHNVRGIAVPRLSLDSTDIKTIYLPGDLMVATRRRGSYTTTGSSSSMGTTSVGQSANTSTGVWSGASGTELPDDNSHDVVCAPHLQLAGPDLGERLFYARHVLRTVAADLLVWPYNVEQCGRQNLPLYVSAWTSLMPHREIVVAVLDRAFAMDNSRDDLKLMLEHVHQPDKYPAGVPQVYRKLVASLAGRGDSGSERTASLLFLSSEQSNFPSVGNWTQLDAFVQSELVAALQSGHTVGRVPFARDCTFAPGRDEDTADAQSMNNFSKTSVLFVSVSFIILMIISLAWLVFYYVQRFRYAHAKDRLARRLFNAARKALTKIPTRVVRAGDADLDTDCPVCIDPYAVGDMVRSLPCRHVFHKTCVDPWLLEHRTCPMCKMDILKAFGYTCSRAATCGNSPGAAGGAASPAGVLGSASSQDNDEIIDDDDDDEELEDDSAAAQPAQRRHSQRPRSRHNSATNSDSYHRDLSYPNSAAEHTEGRHPPRERHPFNDGRDNVAVVHQVLTEQTATGFNIIPLTVHGEPEGQRRRNSTSSRQGNESRCRSLASACHSSSQRQHAAKGAGRASSANASAPAACSRPWAATSGAPVELAVLQHQSVAEVHHPPQADASPASPKSDGRRSPDALIPHAEAYHSASCTPHLSERRQCLQSGGGAGPQQPASSGRHVLVSAARRPATALPPEYGAVLVKVAPRNGAHAEGRNELGGQAGGRPRTNSRSFSAKLRRSQDAGGEASIDQAANHMQMDVLSAS